MCENVKASSQRNKAKPNFCFSKEFGYCTCVTILPMLISQFELANLLLGRVSFHYVILGTILEKVELASH